MKNNLFRLLAVLAAVSMLAATVSAQTLVSAPTQSESTRAVQPLEAADAADLQRVGEVYGEIKGATGLVNYIVYLEDPAVPSYTGGVAGLRATNPVENGAVKLDLSSSEVVAYRDYLSSKQDVFVAVAEAELGHEVDVKGQYQFAINGLSLELAPEEATRVAAMDGVARVVREWTEYAQTDAGPEWIGADDIWDGEVTEVGTRGEGIIIGILDTGINTDHPSFADVGDDAYDHTNPWGAGVYTGWCDSNNPNYDPALACNDKLIGMWSFDTDSPEDVNGHGSHTGSTAAGNVLIEAVKVAHTTEITRNISGVAPHANVIGYSIEDTPGSGEAPGTIVIAATEQAILDGVDVINYSFGGGPGDPWATAEHWLNVRDAGIFVATSAGNDGPGEGTVGSPGNAPWMLTVANSTHNRKVINTLADMTGGDSPPADIIGKGVTSEYGPAPIVYAAWYPNDNDPEGDPAQCLEPYPTGTFNGEIVVCDRGDIARVDKGANVLAGGAGGLILVNTAADAASIVGDDHYLPAVHITYSDGLTLKAWLTNTIVQSATISGATLLVNDIYADIMTASSSRGPNYELDLIKPDVSAPGQDILAAVATDPSNPAPYPEYDFYTGTSMSSPHVAGAGALIRAVHPDWTAAQIQSALMTTSLNTGMLLKEDGTTTADPFDVGAGRVDVSTAVNAGLVLDETTANFEAADPGAGGDPKTLNLASFANDQCVQTCSWTRVVSSTWDVPVHWTSSSVGPLDMGITITPTEFTIPAGGTQVITVEVDVTALDVDEWYFAEVGLTSSEPPARQPDAVPALPSNAHFPIAVISSLGDLPDSVEINTRRDTGSELFEDMTAVEIAELTIDVFGLQAGEQTPLSLLEDSVNDSPYDDLADGVYYMTATVPSGAARFIAEILDSTASDVDLYTGHDDNGNGLPEEGEQLCSSTTGSWAEFCELTEPPAGDYWVLVQNWNGSASQPDDILLSVALVSGDAGNMTVEGPTSVPAGTPFDLRVYWNDPALEAGDIWYGAIALGTDGENPGNLGVIPVDLYRWDDDVVKTVSASGVDVGDVLTYTITINPNITPEDLIYAITDTIPISMTYVPDSASASDGVVSVAGDTLTWSGVMPTILGASGKYVASTSLSDPMCDTGFGGYVNLEDFGIFPQSGISGDSGAWTAFSSQNPVQFYGVENTGVNFTDDGIAFFDSGLGTEAWVNTSLPNAAEPNDLMAMFWNDMEVVYDGTPGNRRGVSLATAGSDTSIIEYDDISPYGVTTTPLLDFEVVIWHTIDDSPGAYEIVYAYDNVTNLPPSVTIGTENQPGTAGTEVLYGDPSTVISDGLMICLDYQPLANPVIVTYQVTVDEGLDSGNVLTNEVLSITDNPGDVEATTSVDVVILYHIYLPVVHKQ